MLLWVRRLDEHRVPMIYGRRLRLPGQDANLLCLDRSTRRCGALRTCTSFQTGAPGSAGGKKHQGFLSPAATGAKYSASHFLKCVQSICNVHLLSKLPCFFFYIFKIYRWTPHLRNCVLNHLQHNFVMSQRALSSPRLVMAPPSVFVSFQTSWKVQQKIISSKPGVCFLAGCKQRVKHAVLCGSGEVFLNHK